MHENFRVRSNDAIRYVRLKRPNMVQTRRQIQCVKEFETYFLPQVSSWDSKRWNLISFVETIPFQCVVYSTKPPNERDKKLGRFPVETCLKRSLSLSLSFHLFTNIKFSFPGKSTWCMVSRRGRWNTFRRFSTSSVNVLSGFVIRVRFNPNRDGWRYQWHMLASWY